jgi:hypothetical protein
MPLPVVSDVFLCRLIFQDANAPRDATCDLYFKDTVGTQTGDDLATDFAASVRRDQWAFQKTTTKLYNLKTTKLDGSAASLDHLSDSNVKWTGQASGELILQGANVVSVKTGFRGRSRRGRIYLPWVAEDVQSNGTLQSASVTAAQTAWTAFFADMVTAGWTPHVVSPLHGDSVAAVAYTVRSLLRTQRRRVRR